MVGGETWAAMFWISERGGGGGWVEEGGIRGGLVDARVSWRERGVREGGEGVGSAIAGMEVGFGGVEAMVTVV